MVFFLYSANQTLIHLDLHKGKADKADCLAVSRSSWEMTQYSLKAEMLELESQYGGKNVSICNQLEQSGCSRISK